MSGAVTEQAVLAARVAKERAVGQQERDQQKYQLDLELLFACCNELDFSGAPSVWTRKEQETFNEHVAAVRRSKRAIERSTRAAKDAAVDHDAVQAQFAGQLQRETR